MGDMTMRFDEAPRDPLKDAIETLRQAGCEVVAADIPGLLFVNGRELTTGQIVSVASRHRRGEPLPF